MPTLPKMKSINGDADARQKKIRNVETPDQNRDAENKKWVEDNFVAI